MWGHREDGFELYGSVFDILMFLEMRGMGGSNASD